MIHVIDSKSDGDFFGDLSSIYEIFPYKVTIKNQLD